LSPDQALQSGFSALASAAFGAGAAAISSALRIIPLVWNELTNAAITQTANSEPVPSASALV